MASRVSLAELVERFGGACRAPLDQVVSGFAALDVATPEHLAFVTSPRYRDAVASTQAAAVLVTAQDAAHFDAAGETAASGRLWVCSDPYLQFARVAQWFDAAQGMPSSPGVHPTASIAPSATVDATATIGPMAVVAADATIGAGVHIGASTVVGERSRVGTDSVVHAGVTIYHGCTIGARAIVHSGAVIGADGFGFAKDGPRWIKIPQVGGVRIGDDVEIGANTTIDRGALSDTVIGDGVKLDNQIQVAHNVVIGEHTIIAACVGIAGSAVIGRRCMIGGAARIMGHVTIADDVVVSTQTFVSRSITKAGRYTGYYPMAEHAAFEKNAAVLRRLDGLRDRVRQLESVERSSPPSENPS